MVIATTKQTWKDNHKGSMKFRTTPCSGSFHRATHRAAQLQTAGRNRLAATVRHLNDLHEPPESFKEDLGNEEDLRWLEDAFEVHPGESELLSEVPVT